MKFTSLSDGSGIVEMPPGQGRLEVKLESPGSFRLYKYEQQGELGMMVPPASKDPRC
jgi:hypothetical protein